MAIFSRIVIVGVGLIGGSLGLAVKKQRLAEKVVGIARHAEDLRIALRREAIDEGTIDLIDGIQSLGPDVSEDLPELVIVCTPVGAVVETVRKIAAGFGGDSLLPIDPSYPDIGLTESVSPSRNILITDVGSTKEAICSALAGAESPPLPNNCRFIGSHPITGKEFSGPEHAEGDLFDGRVTILTPTSTARAEDLAILKLFWNAIGSTTLKMIPLEHDRILSRTSHLPHLLAVTLAEMLLDSDASCIGPGYRSLTRVAAGSPEVWNDVIATNRTMILEAIRDFQGNLARLRELIEQDKAEEVATFLQRAKKNRAPLGE